MTEQDFEKAVDEKRLEKLSSFRSSHKKVKLRCLECGHEWEKIPRDLIRHEGRGCGPCAYDARRKPNEVVSEVDNVLVLNVANAKWPQGVMLIYKKKWEILQREKIGRVWLCSKGYAKADWKGKTEFVHRILMGFPQAPDQVDHINGVKHDNRMSNLRIVTALENQMNRGFRKTNTSGVIGVSFHKGRWEAKLCVDRKVAHKSRHDTKEAAVAARAKAVAEHCGEFAPIGSFRGTYQEDPPRVLDGSKWVDGPVEDFSRG